MEADTKPCCAPSRSGTVGQTSTGRVPGTVQVPQPVVEIGGGRALVGTASPLIPDDGEGPPRHKRVAPFRITTTTITNETFARFVAETGYVTEAERFGWSFVFHSDVPTAITET